ncbi:MAG: molecular chaperone HtpG [Inquilinus sp.]|nr:molecular chaperone HtpG [Inquilinus sp.]
MPEEERLPFQAEVSRLLEIVAKSLYSEKEVFLRELISNASDACDRLRYAALTNPDLVAEAGGGAGYRIVLSVDAKARTLTIADNGIGMNRDELLENLGTIARSGTAAFVKGLGSDAKKDTALIGQFGVGFYSAFMVADHVAVLTRKAGESNGWRWTSDGKGEYTIAETGGLQRGTRIVLHLSEGEDEFLDEDRLRQIVKTHSDHIAVPIVLARAAAKEDEAPAEETLNRASALWTRPRSEIDEEQYREFYRHVAHAFDEPWMTLHYRAEGKIEYTALLFVPTAAPFDLFHPDRQHRVKLYVRRVFVSDHAEGLLPPYLRFLRGIVDSEDLPLNVSREMLQNIPLVAKIRHGLTRRVLGELAKKAESDAEGYAAFWGAFGPLLKEGAYEDFENREALLGLLRFRSTAVEGWTSLADYLGRMKEGQAAIYTIVGDDLETLKKSPQLEGFRARGVEVLLLTDPVDEFWIPAVAQYQDKLFKSVTRGGADLDTIAKPEAEGGTDADQPKADTAALIAAFKAALGDQVKDIRASNRLTDSPVCLVADEGDMDMHLERLLKQHKQLDTAAARILEINPGHRLIARLADEAQADGGAERLADMAFLLLDQARIVEGETLPDPAAFARRMAEALERGLTV